MGERLKNYLKVMEGMLVAWEQEETAQGEKNPSSKQTAQETKKQQARQKERVWQAARAKQELLTQIAFFQHERLIHLIVTALFALLSMIVLIWLTVDFKPEAAVLFVLLLVLLVPYIRHYYILENGTQKLYGYYDRLTALLGKMEEENKNPPDV